MRTLRPLSAALAATALVALSACATGPGTDDAPAGDGVFPVTIQHVYGETTVPAQPERVAAVAWANQEVPLALGVVPVIMEEVTWGDDDGDGILPWVEDKLAELGAEPPVLYDPVDGIDFEAVADAAPDVILASTSGITEEEYETLSAIAPTIAFPDVAWGTSYEEMIEMNATAIGLAAEGQALIDDLHAQVEAALADHTELEGTKFLFSYIDPADFSQIGFYTTVDTRPGFLADNGFPMPQVVEEESAAAPDLFYTTVSAEQADRFADVDVFITYGDPEGDLIAQLQADPLLSQIPAIAEGRIVILPNATPLATSANPSPLSIPWGIGDYFALLAGPLS